MAGFSDRFKNRKDVFYFALDGVGSGVSAASAAATIETEHGEMPCEVWHYEIPGVIRTFGGRSAALVGAAFSSDERRIASASYHNTMKVRSTESGAEIASFTRVVKSYCELHWGQSQSLSVSA